MSKDDFALGNDNFVDRDDNGLHTFVEGATTAQRSPSRAALQELIHNLSCFESAHTTEGFGVDDCRGNSPNLQSLEYLRQGGAGDGRPCFTQHFIWAAAWGGSQSSSAYGHSEITTDFPQPRWQIEATTQVDKFTMALRQAIGIIQTDRRRREGCRVTATGTTNRRHMKKWRREGRCWRDKACATLQTS